MGGDSRWRVVVGADSLPADASCSRSPPERPRVAGTPRTGGGGLAQHHRVRIGGRDHPLHPDGAIRSSLYGTGFLVPRTSTVDGSPALITGCTYLGRSGRTCRAPVTNCCAPRWGRFGDERHRDLDDDGAGASVFGRNLATSLTSGRRPWRPRSPVGTGVSANIGSATWSGGKDRTVGGRALHGVGGGRGRAAGVGIHRLHRKVESGRTDGAARSPGPAR